MKSQEKELLDLFFRVRPEWEKVIGAQIKNADISRADCISSYFVYFRANSYVERLNTHIQVPLEMIVGGVDVPVNDRIGYVNGIQMVRSNIFSVYDEQAFGVRLHFADGLLTELEAYSLTGEPLNIFEVAKKQITCIVFESNNHN